MAWSEAARRAAAEARKRRAGIKKHPRVEEGIDARAKHSLVRKATNYTGDSRRQGKAVKTLADKGYHPVSGKRVGRKAARRVAARIGDYANE